MRHNVGAVDAFIRFVVGAGLIVLAAWYNATPLPAIVLALLGLFAIGTGLNRSCPLYVPFGITTESRSRTAA
jgi:lipopolysaccharide export LptBFGC system permease protein LptF